MEDLKLEVQDINLRLLLGQVRASMREVVRKELRQYGIGMQAFVILYCVQTMSDRITPAEIARLTFRQPHSISESVTRMEKKGLLKRSTNPDDRKRVRMELTEKGRKALDKYIKLSPLHRMLSSLSQEEKQQLKSHLLTLRGAAMKELGIKRELPFPPI